jgi:hypothetical protein
MFKVISIEIYCRDVVVSIGQSNKQLFKELKHKMTKSEFDYLFSDWDDNIAKGRTIFHDSGFTVIRLKDFSDYGLIAHECFHAVCFIFNKIGMPLTKESDEAYAYLLQYLVNQIKQIR